MKTFAPYAKRSAAIAIDGANCAYVRPTDEWVRPRGIFWTEFARRQARDGGCTKPQPVIPLGVDLTTYYAGRPDGGASHTTVAEVLQDAFIFLNVNRNQPRKRMDLTSATSRSGCKQNPDVTGRVPLPARVSDRGRGRERRTARALLRHPRRASSPRHRGLSRRQRAPPLGDVSCGQRAALDDPPARASGLTTLEGMASGLPQSGTALVGARGTLRRRRLPRWSVRRRRSRRRSTSSVACR
jgi:hypothetical protein